MVVFQRKVLVVVPRWKLFLSQARAGLEAISRVVRSWGTAFECAWFLDPWCTVTEAELSAAECMVHTLTFVLAANCSHDA
eukprot:8189192-Pyramimonas_sp.AAC.1